MLDSGFPYCKHQKYILHFDKAFMNVGNEQLKPTAHSFVVIFFVLPWFCTFAKARPLRDALTFAKEQNATPLNKKSAKKPISIR
ncbi:MAG: hypothetical protein ACFFG0_05085 [Candidatus Thorarchaeota archaeon]